MADIELIVKIPEEKIVIEYGEVISIGRNNDKELADYIFAGTPLPKRHGDLITKEQAIELVEFYQLNPQHFDFVNLIEEIKNEKPIIEADKGDKE